MRTTLLLLALLAGPVLASQTVWKWVDSNGVTHYSDRPVPGATAVQLATGSSRANTTSRYSTPNTTEQQDAGPPYSTFEIWQPSDGETIPNTGGQVTVNVRLEPDLEPGHSLHLYLDGKLVEGQPANTNSFDLTDVPRGTHSVVAVVTRDRGGQRLQSTGPVTFHVRQESVAQPPVGPALRPPPKPQPRAGNKMPTSQPTYAALNPVRSAPIDPSTNKPVVTKPAPKPVAPKAPGK